MLPKQGRGGSIDTASDVIECRPSIRAQRVDGIERRRPPRREIAEDHPDHRGDRERNDVDPEIEHERHLHQRGQHRDDELRDDEADHPAQARQRHRLDQELQQHLACDRADREADADLARAFGHRHQHDVHDPDAADDQADRGDRGDDAGEERRRAGQCVADLFGVEDVEVVFLAPGDAAAFAHQVGDRCLDRRGRIGLIDPDQHQPDILTAGKAPLDGLDRHQHDIILIAESALPARRQRADHVAADVTQAKSLADRVGATEQIGAHRIADDADRLARGFLGGLK